MSKLKENVESFGWMILVLIFLIVFYFIATLFLEGSVWLGSKIIPWLAKAGGILFLVQLFVFTPLAFFRKTKAWSGIAIFYSSYLYGATLWLLSAITAYSLWGAGALIIGLMIFGVGVLPVAFLASLIHGEWLFLGGLTFMTFLTFGSRFLGAYLMSNSRNKKRETTNKKNVIHQKPKEQEYKVWNLKWWGNRAKKYKVTTLTILLLSLAFFSMVLLGKNPNFGTNLSTTTTLIAAFISYLLIWLLITFIISKYPKRIFVKRLKNHPVVTLIFGGGFIVNLPFLLSKISPAGWFAKVLNESFLVFLWWLFFTWVSKKVWRFNIFSWDWYRKAIDKITPYTHKFYKIILYFAAVLYFLSIIYIFGTKMGYMS
ncbi:MAG: hypothetical protein ABEJ24_05025 [Candidatus Magasanikbacteria bacterium]